METWADPVAQIPVGRLGLGAAVHGEHEVTATELPPCRVCADRVLVSCRSHRRRRDGFGGSCVDDGECPGWNCRTGGQACHDGGDSGCAGRVSEHHGQTSSRRSTVCRRSARLWPGLWATGRSRRSLTGREAFPPTTGACPSGQLLRLVRNDRRQARPRERAWPRRCGRARPASRAPRTSRCGRSFRAQTQSACDLMVSASVGDESQYVDLARGELREEEPV